MHPKDCGSLQDTEYSSAYQGESIRLKAEIVLSWDEGKQGYYLCGVFIPADSPVIVGVSNQVWEYRDGKLVAGLSHGA